MAKVDLPQPDLPTIATVSDSARLEADRFVRLHDAAFAAAENLVRGDPVVFPEIGDLEHRRAGLDRLVLFLRALRHQRPVDFVEADAAAEVVVVPLDRNHGYFGGVADTLHEMMAARPEIAALRAFVRQRQLAGNGDQRPRVLIGAGQRDGAEQTLRVGVAHAVEDVLDRAALDRLAGIHDGDAVAGLQDQPQIVRYEDHRRAVAVAEILHQVDDAGLHRHVERGGRFVEQEQRRLRQQRHCDDDALLLAAGELMRIGLHHPLGVGQAHRLQHLQGALVGLSLADLLVDQRHLHELLPDLHGGIEARHRLLVDHRDLRAAQAAQFRLRQLAHVAALELDAAADDLPDIGEVAHDAEGDGGFAAAGFPDDSHRLARHDRAGKVHDRRNLEVPGEEGDGEVLDLQDGGGGLRDGCVHGQLNPSSIVRASNWPAG